MKITDRRRVQMLSQQPVGQPCGLSLERLNHHQVRKQVDPSEVHHMIEEERHLNEINSQFDGLSPFQ